MKLYWDDLSDRNRSGELRPCGEENSETVSTQWAQSVDPYVYENVFRASHDIASLQYFSLTGERIVFRMKVLSLPVDGEFLSDSDVLAARPFMDSDVAVAELLDKDVKIAMAYVPLTFEDGVSGAVLARLYCVSGLKRKFSIPFDSAIPRGAECFSWFLAGCQKSPRPAHESWHLAAGLLMRVLQDDNVTAKRNLATSFIVTGCVDWRTGVVAKVDMGQKMDVVSPELRNLIWIIPTENKNELSKEEKDMSKKIECPATLEKAYELILTMQNEATKAMLSLLDKPNFAAFESQLKIGADIQAVRKDLNVRPLQAVTMQIDKLSAELGTIEDAKDPRAIDLRGRLSDLRKMKARLYREGAGAAFLFWNYAKAGRRDMIEELAKEYDVNSCDECGDSAVDMAIDAGDKDAEELLRSYGIHAGPYHRIDPKVNAALKELNTGKLSRSGALSIAHAFDAGLSPETRIEWDDSGVDENGPYGAVWSPTLFEVLIAIGNVMLIERCISMGSDVNAKRTSYGYDPFDNEREELCRERVPLQWARSEDVKDCLVRHGARLTAN